uniref:Uncharacterized protein n=1 Tax=Pithovirus LCPAC401 TaxID=2506595 RepID=A0A481Z9Q4_9VIRU|nr:MAG: hypothetical protein LCPAC401_02810 [Pithovirus LCPAC401]
MPGLTPVKQYTMEGKFIKRYTSMKEAHEKTNVKVPSIAAACTGKIQYSAGGFRWSYADKSRIVKVTAMQRCTPINQLDTRGNIIRTFSSIAEAATELSLHRVSIYNVCKGKLKSTKGYYFEYVYIEDTNRRHKNIKPLNRLSLEGKFINRFDSATEAAKILSIGKGSISRSCRLLCACKGFRFEYR